MKRNKIKYISFVFDDVEVVQGATFDSVTEMFSVEHELYDVEDRHGFPIAQGTHKEGFVLEHVKDGLFRFVDLDVQQVHVFSKK